MYLENTYLDLSMLTIYKGSRRKLNTKKKIAHDDVTRGAMARKILKKIIDLLLNQSLILKKIKDLLL